MRLNFSGVTEGEIREGVRRIGKVVAEQVALYETLTGELPAVAPPPRSEPAGRTKDGGSVDEDQADVLPFRRTREGRG
jgi:2-aminoadipate transaminase